MGAHSKLHSVIITMRQTAEQYNLSHSAEEGISVAPEKNREADAFQASFEALPGQIRETLGEEEQALLRQVFDKDRLTFEHSLAVTRIVDKVWPAFAKEMEQQGITYPDIARAAALHDVGKLSLPDCILKSTIQQEQFAEQFRNFAAEQPERATALMRNKGLLSEQRTVRDLPAEAVSRLDYRDIVPLEFCFRDKPAAMAEIIHSGLDARMTFLDALKRHEAKSKDIIRQTHLPDRDLVAALAGTHHNYGAVTNVRYQQGDEIKLLPVQAAEVLHISDVYQAMTGHREYQAAMTEASAAERLSEMARQGLVDRDVAERWLQAYRSANSVK